MASVIKATAVRQIKKSPKAPHMFFSAKIWMLPKQHKIIVEKPALQWKVL